MAGSSLSLQRPNVHGIVFDYKTGRTKEGWPLEHIKGGDLPSLVEYLCFYATRAARPRLAEGGQPLGCDPDFVNIFLTMFPLFSTAQVVMEHLITLAQRAQRDGTAIGAVCVCDALSLLLHPRQLHFLRLSGAQQQDVIAGTLLLLPIVEGMLRCARGVEKEELLRGYAAVCDAMRAAETAVCITTERGVTVPSTESATLRATLRVLATGEDEDAASSASSSEEEWVDRPLDLTTCFPTLWDTPLDVLACQWTHVEAGLFTSIPMPEWLDCGWDKPGYEHRSDRIRRAIGNFNACALWVTAEVLAGDTPAARAGAIVRFIKTALSLRAYNNFPALVEVCLGLRREAVARLGSTWALVPPAAKEHFSALAAIADDAGNYRAYKEALRGIPRGVPRVPHLGAHTAEMTMRDQLLPGSVKGADGRDLIHFRRHREMYDMAMNMCSMQQAPFAAALPYPRMPNVINAINVALRPFYFVFEEDREAAVTRLAQRSEKLEPPGAAH